jgi:hypothetical protein
MYVITKVLVQRHSNSCIYFVILHN